MVVVPPESEDCRSRPLATETELERDTFVSSIEIVPGSGRRLRRRSQYTTAAASPKPTTAPTEIPATAPCRIPLPSGVSLSLSGAVVERGVEVASGIEWVTSVSVGNAE